MAVRPRPIHLIFGLLITTLLLGVFTQYDKVLNSVHKLRGSAISSDSPPAPSQGWLDSTPSSPSPNVSAGPLGEPSEGAVQGSRWAYATFLSTRIEGNQKDAYFTATRVLAYQLLHQATTRTKAGIPFLVLVPPHVSARKRKILAAEGAVVIPVENLEPSEHWLHPGETRFVDQFTKLRLFEQTNFERILYMDSDMLLTRNLDDIWNETVVSQVQSTLPEEKDTYRANATANLQADPPSDYVLAGISDTRGPWHSFPPPESDQLNGGFLLLRPDKKLFEYYAALLDTPDLFDSGLMEQSLLNFAHNRTGRMPWKAFTPGKWNVNWPSEDDVKGGCATLHDKFWEKDNDWWIARSVVERWWRVQGRAEGYWQRDREAVRH